MINGRTKLFNVKNKIERYFAKLDEEYNAMELFKLAPYTSDITPETIKKLTNFSKLTIKIDSKIMYKQCFNMKTRSYLLYLWFIFIHLIFIKPSPMPNIIININKFTHGAHITKFSETQTITNNTTFNTVIPNLGFEYCVLMLIDLSCSALDDDAPELNKSSPDKNL